MRECCDISSTLIAADGRRRPTRTTVRLAPIALAALAMTSCVTTVRMHSQEELATVTERCGLSLGDVVQFEEEPRLVFLMPVERAEQFVCVRRWARRAHLHLVYMEEEAEPQ
ncbi:MAG TPA: hypothetical protein VF702_05475 [Allosphingosinicella sp.]|jgi:hypothetical protein